MAWAADFCGSFSGVITASGTTRHLLVDLEVLGGVSPLGGQHVTSWAGQRIPDQKVAVTLHQVFCDLQQHKRSQISTHTHGVCFHFKHLMKAHGGRLLLSPTGTSVHLVELKLKKHLKHANFRFTDMNTFRFYLAVVSLQDNRLISVFLSLNGQNVLTSLVKCIFCYFLCSKNKHALQTLIKGLFG